LLVAECLHSEAPKPKSPTSSVSTYQSIRALQSFDLLNGFLNLWLQAAQLIPRFSCAVEFRAVELAKDFHEKHL